LKKIFGPEFWLFTLIYIVLFGWAAESFGVITDSAPIKYSTIFLMCAFTGLVINLASLFARRVGTYWLSFPAALVIVEWTRTSILYEYSFGFLGAVWIYLPLVFMQTASLVGAYGLSFLTVFLPLAIATKHFKTAAAVVLCVLGFGAWRLSLPERLLDYNIRIVSIDKGKDGTEEKIRAYGIRSMFPGWEEVDLFVWPETLLDSSLSNPGREISIVNNARSSLVFGYVNERDGKKYNSFAVFRGHDLDIAYDKLLLAIYGEYLPWWLPNSVLEDRGRHYITPGERPRSAVELSGKRAFPFICFESIFPGLRVLDDIDFMLNISSDYWQSPRGKRLHYGLVRLAAISEGVPVVRSADHGTSAIISPFGREIVRLDGEGILDGRLPARVSRTLFSRTGNWLVLLSCLGILIIAAAGSRRGRKP